MQTCRRCGDPLPGGHKSDLCRAKCQKERARAVCLHRTVVALPEADFRRWMARVLFERTYGQGGVDYLTEIPELATIDLIPSRYHQRVHPKTVDLYALPLPAAGKEKDHG